MAYDGSLGGRPVIASPREKMRSALCRAKSELYNAHCEAAESADEMADRIYQVYETAERLWLDTRSEMQKKHDALEAGCVAEYGPRLK